MELESKGKHHPTLVRWSYLFQIIRAPQKCFNGLNTIPADDFMLNIGQLVGDVFWIGVYWSGPPNDGDFDWRVTFYDDFGDGTKPGAVIATYTFPNADVNETFIEEFMLGYFMYSY